MLYKGRELCGLCERTLLRGLLGLMKKTTEAWCKALYSGDSHGIQIPPRDQRRLSEEAPLEDTGRPKLLMVILQFDATCSALCKATE